MNFVLYESKNSYNVLSCYIDNYTFKSTDIRQGSERCYGVIHGWQIPSSPFFTETMSAIKGR